MRIFFNKMNIVKMKYYLITSLYLGDDSIVEWAKNRFNYRKNHLLFYMGNNYTWTWFYFWILLLK